MEIYIFKNISNQTYLFNHLTHDRPQIAWFITSHINVSYFKCSDHLDKLTTNVFVSFFGFVFGGLLCPVDNLNP